MGAVQLDLAGVQDLIAGLDVEGVVVAAVNAANAVVVSGPTAGVAALVAAAKAAGHKAKQLTVTHAFHSKMVEPAMATLRQAAQALKPAAEAPLVASEVVIVSNVTGQIMDPADAVSPDYWVSHAVGAVRFADGLETMFAALGCSSSSSSSSNSNAAKPCIVVEVGPQPHLSAYVRAAPSAEAGSIAVVPTLRRNRDDATQWATTMATLAAAGVPVAWAPDNHQISSSSSSSSSSNDHQTAWRRVRLPPTALVGASYWLDGLGDGGDAGLAQAAASTAGAMAQQQSLPVAPIEMPLVMAAQWTKETASPASTAAGQLQLPLVQMRNVLILRSSAADTASTAGAADVAALCGALGGEGVVQVATIKHDNNNNNTLADQVQAATAQRPCWDLIVLGSGIDGPASGNVSGAAAAHVLLAVLQAATAARVAVVTRGVHGHGSNSQAAVDAAPVAGHDEETKATSAAAMEESTSDAGSPSSSLLVVEDIAHAASWGLVKSARHELILAGGADDATKLQCIDLPASSNAGSAGLASALAAELLDPDFGAENVLLRRTAAAATSFDRLVQRVEAVAAGNETSGSGNGPLPEARVVALTGGTGALGLITARWLVEKAGVEHLILLSRSGRVAASNQALWVALLQHATVGTKGSNNNNMPTVEVVPCDVSDARQVDRFVSERRGQLAGGAGALFHCAGILRDGMLAATTAESMAQVAAPKSDAAIQIHEALLRHGVGLAYCVLFSSVTALMGNVGQTSYGAANAVLDALAAARCSLGMPTVSVQWGPWAEYGMATSDAVSKRRRKSIWQPITNDEGLRGLQVALRHVAQNDDGNNKGAAAAAAAAVAVQQVDVSVLQSSSNPHTRRLFSSLVPEVPQGVAAAATTMGSPAVDVAAQVATVLSGFLKDVGGGSLTQTPLADLGLDSIDSTEIIARLNGDLGLRLSPALLMDSGATVADLQQTVKAAYDRLPPKAGRKAVAATPATVQVQAQASMAAAAAAAPAVADRNAVLAGVLSILGELVVEEESKGSAGGGLSEATAIDGLGLDSIDSTEMTQQLNRRFQVRMPPSLVMDVATVGDLVNQIHGAVQRSHSNSSSSSSSSKGSIAIDIAADPAMTTTATNARGLVGGGGPTGASSSSSSSSSPPCSYGSGVGTYDEDGEGRLVDMMQYEVDSLSRRPSWARRIFLTILDSLVTLIVLAIALAPVLVLESFTEVNTRAWTAMAAPKDVATWWLTPAIGGGGPEEAHRPLDGGLVYVPLLVAQVAACVISCLAGTIALKWLLAGRYVKQEVSGWSFRGMRLQLADTAVGVAQTLLPLVPNALRVTFYRLMGAHIGRNVLLLAPVTHHDLVHIGDDAIVERSAVVTPAASEDGSSVALRPIVIGAGAFVGVNSCVRGGTILGRGATVVHSSMAQGIVPDGATVYQTRVIRKSDDAAAAAAGAVRGVTMRLGNPNGCCAVAVELVCSFALLLHVSLAVAAGLQAWFGFDGALGPAARAVGIDLMGWDMVLGFPVFVLAFGLAMCLQGIAAKWLVLGRVRPGRRRITAGLYARHSYVHNLLQVCYLGFVEPWCKVSLPLYLWLRVLGAKISFASILSPIRDNVTTNADLITVKAGAYIGNRPGIYSTEVVEELQSASDAAPRLEVVFHGTELGENSFLGPNSNLFGGARLSPRSAVGAMANVVNGATVPTGTAHVGFDKRSSYRPRHVESQGSCGASSAAFHVRNMAFALYLTVLQLAITAATLWGIVEALQAFGRLPTIDAYINGGTDPVTGETGQFVLGRAFWLASAGFVGLAAVARPLVAILYGLVYVLHKWLLLGTVKAGVEYPLRGAFHSKWVFLLNMYTIVAGQLDYPAVRNSPLLSWFNRLLGAKVGRNVKFRSILFPEADCYTIGDNSWIGLHGIYCHDFFQMHLVMRPVTVGRGSRIEQGQVVPGTHLGPGSHVGPASLVLPGRYNGPCDLLQGMPAGFARRGPGREWIQEDDDSVLASDDWEEELSDAELEAVLRRAVVAGSSRKATKKSSKKTTKKKSGVGSPDLREPLLAAAGSPDHVLLNIV